jgi:hypothetical protein
VLRDSGAAGEVDSAAVFEAILALMALRHAEAGDPAAGANFTRELLGMYGLAGDDPAFAPKLAAVAGNAIFVLATQQPRVAADGQFGGKMKVL